MFSFHKPKIYRSLSGCCICKAKSSSSRFTDSKKYEPEFEKCFRISGEKRTGDICNACVLLVKRWKKLPSGTTRDWHHVVDARQGPGTKSFKTKINNNNNGSANKHKHQKHITNGHYSNNEMTVDHTHTDSDDDIEDEADDEDDNDADNDEMDEEFEACLTNSSNQSKLNAMNGMNGNDSDIASNTLVDTLDTATNTANKISSFLDMSFWRKEKICCGIIFKGPDNEVLIYPKLLDPCCCRKNNANLKAKLTASDQTVGASINESEANTSSGNNTSII